MNALAAVILVRRMKRRTLFILSEVISSISMMVLGGYFFISKNDNDLAASLGWLPLVWNLDNLYFYKNFTTT